MTHKYHEGIETSWKLHINRRHYIEIFIWYDRHSMYTANDYNKTLEFKAMDKGEYSPDKNHNFMGQATVGIRCAHIVGNRCIEKIPKKFGEIFFVTGITGVGIVSHEIQHIVNYWCLAKNWNVDRHDEKIAMLTGELNRRFWIEFYKRYA